ncbi:hypothetical protein [Nocardia sp. alder85J]|uniref:hypothetical protein n=1 Tax=Nocardia sp. alder85J TaxID=2862949 RepID=UPI001CD749A8|nr:hypothetical protein [Nocardia sp. alder85J]MCX4095952.1 hypothetical protein [Nocardia sp. alder85J]
METVITQVAVEGKRLIDAAWLGKISRAEAVHMFVQFGDGMIQQDTAEDIIDDGLAWLDAHSARLRLLGWCTVLELPLFGLLVVLSIRAGEFAAAGVALLLLAALQYVHRRFTPHPTPILRRARR